METKIIENTNERYSVREDGYIYDHVLDQPLPTTWNGNYLCCNIIYDKGSMLDKMHRVVAKAFIPNTEGYTFVWHKDKDRSNNHVSNLFWAKSNRPPSEIGLLVDGVRYTNKDTKRLQDLCGCSHEVVVDMMRRGLTEDEMYLGGMERDELITLDGRRGWTLGHLRQLSLEERMRQRKVDAEERLRKEDEERERKLQERIQYTKDNLEYGVGLYDYWNIDTINRDAKDCWSHMLRRCYDKRVRSWRDYSDVIVCEEWHTYSNFLYWWNLQYKEKGWVLDKDIKDVGAREYNHNNCIIVPRDVNHIFRIMDKITLTKHRRSYTLGTTLYNKPKKYRGKDLFDIVDRWWLGKREMANKTLSRYLNVLDESIINCVSKYDPIKLSIQRHGKFDIIIKTNGGDVINILHLW